VKELASPKCKKYLPLEALMPKLTVLTIWLGTLLFFFFSPSYHSLQTDKLRMHYLKSNASKNIPTQNPRLNINQAGSSELIQLPGIGPALAKRMIEYRQAKSFANEQDLLAVKGIGPKKLAKIKNLISY
jgi:competence ComEA-like helix-hairpin-helix protein